MGNQGGLDDMVEYVQITYKHTEFDPTEEETDDLMHKLNLAASRVQNQHSGEYVWLKDEISNFSTSDKMILKLNVVYKLPFYYMLDDAKKAIDAMLRPLLPTMEDGFLFEIYASGVSQEELDRITKVDVDLYSDQDAWLKPTDDPESWGTYNPDKWEKE